MGSSKPSGTVRTGYAIATGVFLLTLAFGVVVLVSIVVGFLRHGDSLLYGNKLTVPAQVSSEDLERLPPGLRFKGWPDVTVTITDPTTKQMLLRSAADVGPLVLLVAGLWLLRRFMRSVLAGDPFGSPNVRRLRAIGFILVAGAPIVVILNYMLRATFLDTLPPYPSVHLAFEGLSIPGNYLLAGLGVFILAEVFAHGLRLREDVEATI